VLVPPSAAVAGPIMAAIATTASEIAQIVSDIERRRFSMTLIDSGFFRAVRAVKQGCRA